MDEVALGALQRFFKWHLTRVTIVEHYEAFLDLGDFNQIKATLGAVAVCTSQGDHKSSLLQAVIAFAERKLCFSFFHLLNHPLLLLLLCNLVQIFLNASSLCTTTSKLIDR